MKITDEAGLALTMECARVMAKRLEMSVGIINVHRSIDRNTKDVQQLRFGAFLLAYGALEGFFSDVCAKSSDTRATPLKPDVIHRKLNEIWGVKTFTKDWSLRTRSAVEGQGERSRWILLSNRQVHEYLADMKSVRDLLAHGDDPRKATNDSGMLWKLKNDRNSLRIMGVEGFVQAAQDLATLTILSFGGDDESVPSWPTLRRSGLSAEPAPTLVFEGKHLDFNSVR